MPHHIRAFQTSDTDQVVALWEACGLTRPWNDPRADIARKLTVQSELFLVAVEDDRITGTAMAGYDGHRGSLYYVGTDPHRRGEGIAASLVARAEELLIALGCPKVNLMVREGNEVVLDFYAARGYEPFDVNNAGKRLIADS
ncbi:GNAT family acetyltransferase [Microbacterium sp. ZW T5_56]|uniref:GNAT family acetyltransferase n=1 Tax=Microbacterium sp. ZW T5_56 TaxID=3378081 RepID=UPI003852BD32